MAGRALSRRAGRRTRTGWQGLGSGGERVLDNADAERYNGCTSPKASKAAIPGGGQAVLGGLPLGAEELVGVTAEIAGMGAEQVWIDVSERIGGEVLGGVSVQVLGQVGYRVYLPLVLRSH
jgi:hypothetical protein